MIVGVAFFLGHPVLYPDPDNTRCITGEVSPSIYKCRLGEWKIILETQRYKNILANLDDPIKSYDFFKVVISYFLYAALSGAVTSSQQNNGLLELHTNFTNFCFSWKYIFPPLLILYLGILELRWLCMHLWLNLINRTIPKKFLKLRKSMYKVNIELFSCGITDSGRSRVPSGGGQHTKLSISSSLKWIIQICRKFYCWVSKIAFYSPNPHCCLGKLPL